MAGRAIAPKVSFLAPPRTHTGGQFQSLTSQGHCVENDAFQSVPAELRPPTAVAKLPQRNAHRLPFEVATYHGQNISISVKALLADIHTRHRHIPPNQCREFLQHLEEGALIFWFQTHRPEFAFELD